MQRRDQNAAALLQDSLSNSAATVGGLFAGRLNATQAGVAASSTVEQFEL